MLGLQKTLNEQFNKLQNELVQDFEKEKKKNPDVITILSLVYYSFGILLEKALNLVPEFKVELISKNSLSPTTYESIKFVVEKPVPTLLYLDINIDSLTQPTLQYTLSVFTQKENLLFISDSYSCTLSLKDLPCVVESIIKLYNTYSYHYISHLGSIFFVHFKEGPTIISMGLAPNKNQTEYNSLVLPVHDLFSMLETNFDAFQIYPTEFQFQKKENKKKISKSIEINLTSTDQKLTQDPIFPSHSTLLDLCKTSLKKIFGSVFTNEQKIFYYDVLYGVGTVFNELDKINEPKAIIFLWLPFWINFYVNALLSKYYKLDPIVNETINVISNSNWLPDSISVPFLLDKLIFLPHLNRAQDSQWYLNADFDRILEKLKSLPDNIDLEPYVSKNKDQVCFWKEKIKKCTLIVFPLKNKLFIQDMNSKKVYTVEEFNTQF